MEREEAIQRLQANRDAMYFPETIEALDMAIEALQEAQKHEETFEWCHDCKEYDKDNYCCHRWSKAIRNTVEELKADTVSREEYNELLRNKISLANSEEAEPKWKWTANFASEQLDRLRKMTDEERWDFLIKFFSPSADTVQILKDGTLEVKVPNAQKFGRVLVTDTDSHIGGGLFYPDDAVHGEWIDIDNYYRLATCSHCHKVTMFEKWGEYTKPYNFCPNCGARMKGGEE